MKVRQLFESQFATLSTNIGMYYFYKNPTSKEFNDMHRYDDNNKAVIDKDGNLYIVRFFPNDNYDNDENIMLHYDIVEFLQRKHHLFPGVNPLYMNRFQQHIILVQRNGETNNFYLSELYTSSNLKSSKFGEILDKAKQKNSYLNFHKKRIIDAL